MSFEKKIVGNINCPRCNAIAELRIDVYKPKSETVLVYVVCDKCKLKRFHHRTTKKVIRLQTKLAKAKKKFYDLPVDSSARDELLAIINHMEGLIRKYERLV